MDLQTLATLTADLLGIPGEGEPARWERDTHGRGAPSLAWYLSRGPYQRNTIYHLPAPPAEMANPLETLLWVRKALGLDLPFH